MTATPDVARGVDRAVEILRAGGLVALPTETVYGLAGDASNPDAVRRIFAVKGRPSDHPLIVHMASADRIDDWARRPSPAARALAEACWPGPLTLVVPRAAHVLDLVTGGRDTVGLRVPAHPLALEVLVAFGGGVAAPSANRFGRVSPTTADHVRADLGADVDLVLDGGPCPVGVESTIVDCTTDPPQLLRAGGVSPEDLDRILHQHVAPASGPSRAPGMLASHYAPRCAVRLTESRSEAATLVAELRARGVRVELLVPDDDLVSAARQLFAQLRAVDERGTEVLVAVLPPPRGLGHAIRDRLMKAAAPR